MNTNYDKIRQNKEATKPEKQYDTIYKRTSSKDKVADETEY